MTEDQAPRRSALEKLRGSIAGLRSVELRDPGDSHHAPVVRPSAPSGAGDAARASGGGAGGADWPERVAHYQVAGEIARGGMGAILKARDVDLRREVALKVLLPRHRRNPDVMRRFVEEAQIASQLQHPGIVPVHGLGELPGGAPFFSMKLVKGRTLANLLEERRASDEDRLRFLGIFLQVCETVAYAHARRVIHRDLKPSNIMVGSFGEVLVFDWGLAKVLQQSGGAATEPGSPASGQRSGGAALAPPASVIATVRTSSSGSDSLVGSVLGTPAYMAPEQARGDVRDADARTDVFGLGAILCEILTGKPPYDSDSAEETERRARKGYLEEALARLASCGAPADLVELARRSISFEARHRPADAGEVGREVRRHLDSIEERTRRLRVEAAAGRVRAAADRRARRLTLFLATAILALLGAGAGAYGVAARALRERAARAEEAARGALDEAKQLIGAAKASAPGDATPWESALGAARRAVAAADLAGAPEPAAKARELARQTEEAAARAKEISRRAAVDRELAARLEGLRAHASNEDAESAVKTIVSYRSLFREPGLDLLSLSEEKAAEAIGASSISRELVEALDAWAEKARALFGEDSREAARIGAIAARVDPDPLRLRLRRGNARDPGELGALQRLASEVDPAKASPATLALLAKRLGGIGQGPRATALLDRALRLHPGEVGLQVERARFSDRSHSLVFCQAALALRPRLGQSYVQMCHALFGDWEGSRNWGDAGLRLQPSNARLIFYRGTHTSPPAAAIPYFREALRLEPEVPDLHNNLAVSLSQSGDREGALREYREAARLSSIPIVWANLGLGLIDAGDREGGAAALEASLRMGASGMETTIHGKLAEIYRDRRNLPAAAYHRRAQLKIQPRDRGALLSLAETLDELGRIDEALEAIQRAVELAPLDAGEAKAIREGLDRLTPEEAAKTATARAIERLWRSFERRDRALGPEPPEIAALADRLLELRLEILEPAQALREIRALAAARGGEPPDLIALEARTQRRSGDRRGAILTLEGAARRSNVPEWIERRLEEARLEALPDLPTIDSIDAAFDRPPRLAREGDRWRYFEGTRDPSPGIEWTRSAFDDAAWKEGPCGFGYDDGDDRTVLANMKGNYSTVYVRRRLLVPESCRGWALELRVRDDDGFAAYANGEEAGRFRAGKAGEIVPHDALATAIHEAILEDVIDATALLHPGENTLALVGLNDQLNSSDLSLIPEVRLAPPKSDEAMGALLARFRSVSAGEEAAARVAYFEARGAESLGHAAEAAGGYEKVEALAPAQAGLRERRILALDREGRHRDAQLLLRESMQRGLRPAATLASVWALGERASGKSWEEIFRAWPKDEDKDKGEGWEKGAITLVPTAEGAAETWRFTTRKPAADWAAPSFDDASWGEAPAPLGGHRSPHQGYRTEWTTNDIWLRHPLEIPPVPEGFHPRLRLRINYDEDPTIYLGGVEIASLKGWSSDQYVDVPLANLPSPAPGRTVLAIHCQNHYGTQVIDAGLVLLLEGPRGEWK